MKNIFQKSGAQLRARTRALCALTLALFTSAAVSSQDWGNEATGGAGVNIDAAFASVTMNVTTVGATKRVQMTASSGGQKVWLALVVDGSLSVSSIDDIPVGTYTITNTGAPGTALASQGLSGSDIIGTGGLSTAKYLHATGGTAYVFDDNTDDHHHLIHLRATEFHQSVMNSADGRVKCQFTPDGNIMTNTYPTTLSTCGSGTAAGDGWLEGAMFFGYDNTVTATPTAPATFVEWRDGDGNVISTDNPYTFIAWGPKEVVAVFSDGVGCPSATPATPTYEVTATVSPAAAGTVSGTGTYDEGDDVTLTATAVNRRYQFSHWEESSSTVGSAASYSIDDIDADHALVAVFEEIPVTIADNESSSYYASTLSTFSTTMDFRLMRTFKAGMWNTVCFPFDLTSAQRGNSDMSGVTFYTLTSVTGDAAVGLDFNVTAVTTETMTARTPYLVQFTGADIVNPVFEDVTLAASAFTNNTSGTNVGDTKFFGTVHPTALEIGQSSGFLFLGQNNNLYWPNVNNDIRAFRAYFYSGSSTVQSVHPRARIVVKGETPTDVEERIADGNGSAPRKYLHNGVLVIEKNGIRYNAVGQPLSE